MLSFYCNCLNGCNKRNVEFMKNIMQYIYNGGDNYVKTTSEVENFMVRSV